jgi:transposase
MSSTTMKSSSTPRRERRVYTEEFKAGAVRLVLEEGKTMPEVARDLDLTPSAFRNWVEQARADQGQDRTGKSSSSSSSILTTPEREELARLRRENQKLKMERDILKKATAFFARENN